MLGLFKGSWIPKSKKKGTIATTREQRSCTSKREVITRIPMVDSY